MMETAGRKTDAADPDQNGVRDMSLPQQRAFLIQIGAVELGQIGQPVEIVDRHLALLKGCQPVIAQFAEYTVDVHGAEPERIGEVVLRKRTDKAVACTKTNKGQPSAEFEQEMCGPFQCISPTDADQMLDHHRLVPRGRP